MNLRSKMKKNAVAPPRKRSYKVPCKKPSSMEPRKNSNISSKDSAAKADQERTGLYLFG